MNDARGGDRRTRSGAGPAVTRAFVGRSVALVLGVLLVAVACAAGGGDGDDAAPEGAGGTATPPKVTVAGDSIAFAVGAGLRAPLAGEAEVVVIAEGSTGLARPDTFDWPDRLDRLAAEFPPDVLVVSVGSNDHLDLTDASGDVVAPYADEAAWVEEYRARLAAAVDPFADTGTSVVIVGQLRTDDGVLGDTNRRVLDLAREVAADRDHVEVVDLGELTGDGDAVATRCIAADGIHLTEACTTAAAEALAPQLPLG